ncbi:MAG: MucB/RseB C-terminal domain-containing protein [Gammaproteobacteria bacterium]
MLKRLSIIFLLSLGAAASAEDIELDPSQALLKMQQAMELLNYQGTVAFLRNGKLNTLKYSHAASDGWNQERLISLNSPLHEIVRDTDKVSCFFLSSSKVIIDHRPSARSFLIDLPEKLDGLSNYYRFEYSGEEQVAMLTARVLDVLPKDDYRYARRIWIEKQQYLPLKVEVYDHSNKIIEQVVFTDLQLSASLPVVDVDAATAGREIQHIHKRAPDSFDKARFKLDQLPGGFYQQFFIQMSMRDADQPVEHLLLSDGFSSVSVYLENNNDDVELGPHASGSVNAFSRVLGDYLVTVMGEVPAETVQFIAEGVKLRSTD